VFVIENVDVLENETSEKSNVLSKYHSLIVRTPVNMPVPGMYWADAASIGPVQARYRHVMGCFHFAGGRLWYDIGNNIPGGFLVNMPICARIGPMLAASVQNRPSSGMFTGVLISDMVCLGRLNHSWPRGHKKGLILCQTFRLIKHSDWPESWIIQNSTPLTY